MNVIPVRLSLPISVHSRCTMGEIVGSITSGLKWYEIETTLTVGLLPQSERPRRKGE